MTQYIHVNEGYLADGTYTREEVPWTRDDFIAAIEMLESAITTRRMQEAHLTEHGKQWLADQVAKIVVLREAMASL